MPSKNHLSLCQGAVLTLALTLLVALPAFAGDGIIRRAQGADLIKDQYIVVFNAGHEPAAAASELAAVHGGKVKRTYRHALNGALIEMNEARAQAMSRNPKVSYVEQDALSYIVADQANPTWGLDRVDERTLPLDNNYHYDFTGAGVTVFVLDTGIRTTHTNFGGRASWGIDCTGEGQSDGHGHGTHVAGTVGSSTYGVAKGANLVAVKVCTSGGSCPNSAITCGIDYVTQQKQSNPGTPMAANMSLGGTFSSSENQAVANSVAAGVFYAVAAGNENTNACNRSPASEPTAYTVGSTTSSDVRSSFSNYGTCLDIFAPGSSITSTWNTSNTATATISGTSMASPHTAGAGALVLQENPGFTPAQVGAELTARATSGVLSSINTGSPNLLLYTLGTGAPPPPPPPPANCAAGSLDFSSFGLTSYADQNVSNGVSVEDSGSTLFLSGNTWVRSTQSFTVTANTVVEFEFSSGAQGEIHAIGFDENDTLNDSPRHFQFYGTQNWTGTGRAALTSPQYTGAGSFQSFTVPVGQTYTGSMRLVFTNDDDASASAQGRFRCVRVYEDGAPPPPPPGGCTVDDDFEGGATGWVNGASSTCSTGAYVLGNPTLVTDSGVTTQVGGSHSGTSSIFTATNSSAGVNDVDGGNCILESPTWSVTDASNLSVWYFHGQRDAGDDASGDFFRLEMSTNGGSTWSTVASRGDSTSNAAWTQGTASIAAGSSVKLRVQCSDGSGPGDLVECGIDDVSICPTP